MSKKLFILIGFIYFFVGIITLPHYGINWDTINHLPRGQAYLNYFLTGNKDYSNLSPFERYYQDPKTILYKPSKEVSRRSLYQNDSVTYQWYLENDQGHPPASDIFAALFNKVLFQELGFINDIDSYRVYAMLLAAVTITLISWWTATKTNVFAGIIAAISIALYPVFLSESHFNSEKDIPETALISIFIYLVWYGVTKQSKKSILASGVVFGLALGTKFNILFVPLIVAPWLGYRLFAELKNKHKILKLLPIVFSSGVALAIGLVVFIVLWPYLWNDVIGNISKIFGYYKEIGTTTNFDPRFIGPFNVNLFPITWISFTTPLATLILAVIGIFYSFRKITRDNDDFFILILAWFFVPIVRVSFPGSNIYGGIRQIMEFVPAIAILSGIGAYSLLQINVRMNSKTTYTKLLLLLAFVPLFVKMVQIHPNENVYFNKLIGGLSGAKKVDVPFWGNSFGAAYRQGVNWINEHAPPNAHVVYAYELIPNIPIIHFRDDINLHNQYRSGYLQEGEYAITLTYDGTRERSYYDKYLEKFIEPRYEAKVDGVSILKVWENSPEFNKYDLRIDSINLKDWENTEYGIRFILPETINILRLEYEFNELNCKPVEIAFLQISKDGDEWIRLPGVMPVEALIPALGVQPTERKFITPFTGELARFIDISISPTDSCMTNPESAILYYIKDTPMELLE